MGQESIRVTRSVSIPPDEIELRVSRSSGRAASTRTRPRRASRRVFDVEASASLTDRAEAPRHRDAPVRCSAPSRRTSGARRGTASSPSSGSSRSSPRRCASSGAGCPTRPTAASRERRLESKRRRAQVKRRRADSDE